MWTEGFTFEVARFRAPAVVIGSSVLLVCSGLARLWQVTAEAISQNAYLGAHEAAGTPGGFAGLAIVFLMVVGLVVSLVALAVATLGLLNLGGWNWTRVATWAVGSVTLAVAGGWFALGRIPSPPGDAADSTDWDRVRALAAESTPDWVEPASTVAGLIASPALLVALVLLALPSANAFYRQHRLPSGPRPGDAVRPESQLRMG
ncbi:hypothetical protein SAMN05421812_117133 [Asanoa hainanensis]|uniref:Tryptophan-associated transmembrane protein (Trp_oprn_chp) n=1 Tax=Asanoa hainanensis TaxID=560556 RepID=A0A239PCB6_9ACTN|nr:hypothetical protein [Asanoa hainanensis]SNT64612.1 hypothetical protein SAMN05421812_117133 [Asanoa hainanensis]